MEEPPETSGAHEARRESHRGWSIDTLEVPPTRAQPQIHDNIRHPVPSLRNTPPEVDEVRRNALNALLLRGRQLS